MNIIASTTNSSSSFEKMRDIVNTVGLNAIPFLYRHLAPVICNVGILVIIDYDRQLSENFRDGIFPLDIQPDKVIYITESMTEESELSDWKGVRCIELETLSNEAIIEQLLHERNEGILVKK